MSHAYQTNTESVVNSYKRIHGNGEETHVHIFTAGDRYAVLAVDLDPRQYDGVDSEVIGYCPTKESADERATAWMEQHAKGVAGDAGGGLVSKLVGMLAQADEKATQNMQGDEQ